jgi:drug/metabolite transporter (DMT)-like permease
LSHRASHPPPLPGPAILGVASFFFATMATLIGALKGEVSAAQLVAVRFGFGALAMLGLFAARKQVPRLERWPMLVLRAFLGSGAVYLYVYAIGQIGPGPATMLNFISPCYAALFAPLFLKERSSRWVLIGLVLATVGAGLVALGAGSGGRPLTALGLGAGLLSGVMSGAATTSVRALRQSTDAFTVYFAFCVFGLLFSAPAAAFDWTVLDAGQWALVLGMSAVSLVAQLLYTYAMAYTETVTAGVANQLAPVFSFGMAVLFLGDRPHGLTLGGAALCIGGVLLGLRAG